ncbi:carboxypeptidase [Aliidiomarina shirensis]|uniref:Carboxypeptidase n=1 Tax=Aliidiomarina shirensis TaxID=1048642 RepID=A0A432WSS6_9GAMM|nr:M14 family metallopeptidase [Aliidiomarina shirensis]RUO36831.1 carboxypeptidase [Aliidiomarina shirensis]
MKARMYYSFAILFASIASSWVHADQEVSAGSPPISCEFEFISFNTEFPTGRIDGCEQTGQNSYTLYLQPENEPINPSPWYAFQIVNASTQAAEIDITLLAQNGPARYSPKSSTDKQQWAAVPHTTGEETINFTIAVDPEVPLYIAGQEIIDNRSYLRWLADLAKTPAQEIFTLGYSSEGRPLPAMVSYAEGSDDWLVLIGRQHPPEITGALAMLHFGNALFSTDTNFSAFRKEFNILVVPNMNPDGVHLGNWRHSSLGLDMNRDWKNFSHPETQALNAFLQNIRAEGGNIQFALDFHSTYRNIYYTMPADYVNSKNMPLRNATLVDNWLDALATEISWDVINRPGHNSDSGVFKQYMADEFAVHAVTYEVGDNTDRAEIKATAEIAAELLIKFLDDD